MALIAGTPAYVLTKWRMHAEGAQSAREGASTFYDPNSQIFLDANRWIIRAPFRLDGTLLGASVWYVVATAYTETPGGYVALGLYVFSPAMVARSSLAQPEIAAAWGVFGTIFTAIAVAHTLYAPREVVLWNWRRITLMGISISLAVGAQFSCALLLLLALGFMWWAVPHRRGSGTCHNAFRLWSGSGSAVGGIPVQPVGDVSRLRARTLDSLLAKSNGLKR